MIKAAGQLATGQSFRSGAQRPANGASVVSQTLVHVIEIQSWGDAGIYLCGPGAGLGSGRGCNRHCRRLLVHSVGDEHPGHGVLLAAEQREVKLPQILETWR